MKAELYPGERLDDLQLKGMGIIQNPKRFCFGIDSVLLSDFVRVKKGEAVLDLGTGSGILPILLAAKTPGRHFTGLEILEDSVRMARRSVEYNGLSDKIDIVQGDIKEASALFGPALFDVIVTNPPYMQMKGGFRNPQGPIAAARHEILCTLADVIREGARLLPEMKGRLYMVHKPFRLAEIFARMDEYNIEPKRIKFICPYIDKSPTMVLIEGMKGGRPGLVVEPSHVMYGREGA